MNAQPLAGIRPAPFPSTRPAAFEAFALGPTTRLLDPLLGGLAR